MLSASGNRRRARSTALRAYLDARGIREASGRRAIKGTRVHVDRDHLHRYVAERAFAYNHRDLDDLGRMRLAMAGTPGRRITYEALTSR